tara:strand:- start:111 stop:608 length:498 start_codon:yes stop_codon:yes gene_type:complete
MNFLNTIKNKVQIKNNFFSFILILVIFFLDRFTKIKILEHNLDGSTLFINDYLNYTLVWNTGIGFGLFSLDANIFYHSITFLIFLILLILIYLILKSNFFDKMLFSLILGGALGNFYDRMIYFAVPDFIDIHYNEYHWFTFNIADIFISIGIVLLLTKDLIFEKK